ncbi:hypothetical protein C6P40_005027 [Pichia californica]|uniref:Ferric oxidoreductase domain-containing protein n=1 Tax=Pichia californica TaxID=460514 RepID=A0A9P6WRC9_9ASCO|nr:hypothetical protein C6P42_004014 [[Candida] californica]KAG0691108.1 hypothetical protein C6P40_005027 [[Candida] californica]
MILSTESTTTIFSNPTSNPGHKHPIFRNPIDHGTPDPRFGTDWKFQRKQITTFYGYLTFFITVVFIIILPWWNRVSNYFYYKFLQLSRSLKLNPKISVLKINPMSAQMIVFWSIVLSILSLSQTNWDLRFIAARLGRVPVYCLPTVLFLTLRPSPLSDVLYLQLLPIHKWLSRIVIIQSLLHTIAYIYIMHQSNSFYKLTRFDNLNGIYAMLAFLIILITSLPFIRRHFYKVFFINHYICTWIVTITLYLHVRPGIPYLTALNCFILIYQIYYKFKISRLAIVSTMKISDQMLVADMPNNSITKQFSLPGCHIRLIDYNSNHSKIWNLLKMILIPIQHPYTLASLPVDKSQKLIIRIGNYKLTDNTKYYITGSYLPHLPFIKGVSSTNNNTHNTHNTSFSMIAAANSTNNMNSLLVQTKVQKCLIVVGGSAISFALPILRVLNYNGSMVKIIWVIRDHEDLKVLDYFQNYLINDDCIDIYITGKYTQAEKTNFKDAMAELHKRKREYDLKQETEILSGGYSYFNSTKLAQNQQENNVENYHSGYNDVHNLKDKNNNGNNNDKNNDKNNDNINDNNNDFTNDNNNNNKNTCSSGNTHSNHSSVDSLTSSNNSLTSNVFSSPNKREENENNIILKNNNNGSSPLNPDHSKNYGSFIFDTQLDKLHRKSCIDFKSHNEKISTSYNDETIDIELHDDEKYKRNYSLLRNKNINSVSILTPSAGVGYNVNNISNEHSTSGKVSSNELLTKFPFYKTNVPTVYNSENSTSLNKSTQNDSVIQTTSPRSRGKNALNNTAIIPSAFNSPINHKLLSGSVSISTSSALYDDLENYWVLKHSFSSIEFGRPKLGLQYYSWCIGSSCMGPLVDLKSGKAVCYNLREDPASGYQINEMFSNDIFLANRKARFSERNGEPDENIWVIGAGPDGLVDNVRLWANDCGFSFHEESFII